MNNFKNISIIIPYYKPNKELLNRTRNYIKKYAKDAEIIEIEGSAGQAKTINKAINIAKGDILITLHQDCVPMEEDSIEKLVKPFKDKNVIMTYSWILDDETQKKYYPIPPDSKFVAYRKSALENVNGFDEKTFFTGGEDVDLWIKMKRFGKIIRVETTLLHTHKGYLGNKTVEKRKQNGSINGALFRIWGTQNPKWLKALIMCIRYPTSYGRFFIRAFILKKQDYRRKE
jgi:GT2 family glycosyltransferase